MYDGGLNGWSYDKPRWCRVLDFDGYNHNATAQIIGFDVPSVILSRYNIVVSIDARESGSDSYSLDMDDILVDGQLMSNWYVGIAIFRDNTLVGWRADHLGFGQYEYENAKKLLN